jgi:adenylate cyclase
MVAKLRAGFADVVRALGAHATWLLPLAVLALLLLLKATDAGQLSSALRNLFVSLILTFVYDAPGEVLRRPESAPAIELMFLAVTGVLMAVLFARRRAFAAGTAMAASLSASSLFAWGMALRWGALFDVFTIAFALLCVFAAGAIAEAFAGKEDRARLRLLTAQFSGAAAAALANMSKADLLAPQRRDITYLLCRIREHAEQAERTDPEKLVDGTRRLLALLERVARQYEATIDRVMPGSLTCIFNAPVSHPEAELRACNCALAMSEAVQRLARTAGAEPIETGGVSIGINSGIALVGDFGSFDQPRYGAAGRIVETAFDLERIAAQYGVTIAVGEPTRSRVDRLFAFLELDLVPRAGSAPLTIYDLAGAQMVRSSPKFRAVQAFHERIFQAYRAHDWARARQLIGQCRALSGARAPLYEFYLDRIAFYEGHPPGELWDGTFRRASAFAEAAADSSATLARRSFSVGGTA